MTLTCKLPPKCVKGTSGSFFFFFIKCQPHRRSSDQALGRFV